MFLKKLLSVFKIILISISLKIILNYNNNLHYFKHYKWNKRINHFTRTWKIKFEGMYAKSVYRYICWLPHFIKICSFFILIQNTMYWKIWITEYLNEFCHYLRFWQLYGNIRTEITWKHFERFQIIHFNHKTFLISLYLYHSFTFYVSIFRFWFVFCGIILKYCWQILDIYIYIYSYIICIYVYLVYYSI